MYIRTGGIDIPIKTNFGRTDRIGELMREFIDVVVEAPLTTEQTTALKSGTWEMLDANKALMGVQSDYTD